jgi:hypothetical protein
MSTVHEIFALWPSASELARDLGLKRESHATVMKHRGSIPVDYWPALVSAAKKRRIKGVTYEVLVAAHARPSARAKDSPANEPGTTAKTERAA